MPAPHEDWELAFWAKVRETSDGCWLWTAGVDAGGYGQFGSRSKGTRKGKTVRAHRIAYELVVGQIPEGLQLDHLCRVRRCVNPAHLEVVTLAENVRRGGNAMKVTCKHGHPIAGPGADVYVDRHGRRHCRPCRARRLRELRARRALI